MIGSVEVRCCAAQPQKPLAPVFSFKDSPQSFRILDVPKAVGEWAITRVYVGLNYPDNTNVEKDATRQGNVWVATVEGCPVAGKTMGGFTIYADGTDENGNAVEGYVLGNGDCYVLDKSEKISALVGKTTMRILDDIPSAPAKGDVLVVGEELKIYNGEEWVTISGGSSEDTYTKAEIDEKVAEIDSSISALAGEIPTKTSDLTNDSGFLTDESQTIVEVESSLSELSTTVGQIQSDVSALDSSLTELESSLTELNDLAVKYADSEKVLVQMNSPNTPFMLKMNDTDLAAGNTRIVWNDGTNYIARNALRIGVPDDGETVQHMGTTNVQMGGVHNDAIVGIGGGITIFSSAEKGKTKMFMDDDRIFVTTPATVEEGQTLKAIKVANENAMSGRSVKMATRDGEQEQEEVEEQDWHWEYVSANLPEKTSDLTNDSGFVTTADVEEEVADKRDYHDLTVQNQIDMPPYYNISTVTFTFGVGQAVMNDFWIDADGNRCWFTNTWFDRQLKTRDGQTFQLVWSDHFTETLTLKQLKEGYTFEKDGQTYSISATFGRGYENMSVSWEGLGYNLYLNKFAVIDDADSYHNTWVVWYKGDLDNTEEQSCWYIRQIFSPGSSSTSTQGVGNYYQFYYRYHGQDVFVGRFTDSSKMTRDTEWHETWTYEDEEGQTVTHNYTILATRNWDNLALESNLEIVSANVSAMTSSVTALGSSVSAMASSIADKRDYDDLTYNTTVPAETIDNSNLVDGTDPLYNAKLTFTVNDSVEGEHHLTFGDTGGTGAWTDNEMGGAFGVMYAEDWGLDPADGKFALDDGSDVCFQFNLQDGVNVQTFNYTSEMLESTGTLTMTFTGEPGHVVADTLALDSNLGAVSASVSTLSSQVSSLSSSVSTLTSQVNANTSAISANASAIADNASAISAMASSISAVAGSLNVSGIGCSTIVLSGTYSDSTSFAYNFVIQPSA